jgi:TPP-dependent indolepyruvate ferredoxin oxidoreductase alpha subunit
MAYFYLGEYQPSLDDFHAALRCSSQSSNKDGFQTSEEESSVSENENKKKIQSFILKAEKGLSEQNKAILKRKSALQKAFHSNSVLESNSKSQHAVATATEGRRFQWNRKEILLFISMICILAIAIFVGTLTLE